MKLKQLLQTLRLIWDYYFVITGSRSGSLAEHLQFKRGQIEAMRQRGPILDRIKTETTARHEKCNHRKGGTQDLRSGKFSQGSSTSDYAIIKHQFPWGDTWVICIRCGKKWKPGMPDYDEALKFPTCNTTSTSVVFQGPGLVERARELTKES